MPVPWLGARQLQWKGLCCISFIVHLESTELEGALIVGISFPCISPCFSTESVRANSYFVSKRNDIVIVHNVINLVSIFMNVYFFNAFQILYKVSLITLWRLSFFYLIDLFKMQLSM